MNIFTDHLKGFGMEGRAHLVLFWQIKGPGDHSEFFIAQAFVIA